MSRLPNAAAIVAALKASNSGPLKTKALANALKIPEAEYKKFRGLLRKLESDGKLYRVKGGRYAAPDKISLVTGRLTTIRSGDGFVRGDAEGDEVFVPERDLDSAMDGDRVVVRIESRPKGLKPVGRVIKVLERAHSSIVGVFHEARKVSYVSPLNPKLKADVTIPWGDEGAATDGDVVMVTITAPGKRQHGPIGEVERVLGRLDDPGVDVLAILFGHGLDPDFPPDVVDEALRVAVSPPTEVPAGREDLRDLLVFTIDPADARDHDDALSYEALEDGTRIGIHIADVSHYVTPGGAIDQEALKRGTSVYLVDRVVPMLPHELSSDVCSLRPDVDRFATTLFVEFSTQGKVRAHRFCRSVIRSRAKLSYEMAQGVLDQADGSESAPTDLDLGLTEVSEEVVREALLGLRSVARQLGESRAARGALDFELPEGRVILDDDGIPIKVVAVERLETHRLVEAFMLLANELVARAASERKLPVLYRIHEEPSEEKIELLREVLTRLGIKLPSRVRQPADLAGALEAVKDKPAEKLVSTLVLRSMQRARYSATNAGHFGLALTHYAHFTSPIRRYPDLVTHRAIIRTLIEGQAPDSGLFESLEGVAERTSWREQVATTAERDSIEMKKIEYLRRHLGEEFDGTITGVKAFGVFVLLDDVLVDGLLHVNGLKDDYYQFDERSMSLTGARQGRVLRPGDRIRVQVARVDKEERQVDLKLVGRPR